MTQLPVLCNRSSSILLPDLLWMEVKAVYCLEDDWMRRERVTYLLIGINEHYILISSGRIWRLIRGILNVVGGRLDSKTTTERWRWFQLQLGITSAPDFSKIEDD